MINPWFKFYGSEYLSDPKIGALSAQERSCWITLLCISSSSTRPGSIEYLTVEVLLEKSGINFDPYHPEEWNACLSILTKLEKMKMIRTNEDGTIDVTNWVKRQETNLTDAERAKSYRDRKKERHGNVTHGVTNVTQEENRKEKNREEANNGVLMDSLIESGFETFWKEYPPTRKQDKQKCLKKWMSLVSGNTELGARIIEDVVSRKSEHEDWVKDNGRYVPAPLVYLNNARWEAPINKIITKKVHHV